ncbi:aminotransferase class IV [Spongiactinospora sp. 9N601]|uniref:aminotransferase class IV n=1 Tax=Spongiactinospora sp. 9N601 TaxID=3375149 RepID=UPI003791E679
MPTPARSIATYIDGRPADRVIPFGSNSMQHGTAVFEGIRCYATPHGPAIFRLDDHLARLLGSARTLGIAHRYDHAALKAIVVGAARESGLADCYLRPVVFTPDPLLDINLAAREFTAAVEVWPAPTATPFAQEGARLTVSSWCRPSRRSLPSHVKATGTYVASAMARTAATEAGFHDALQLDPHSGRVAEATVANVFLVLGGRLHTPWPLDSLLPGITRDTVLRLARDLGVETSEGPVEVGDLYAAQEVFLTGTASELVPVAALDEHSFPGDRPTFRLLWEEYRATVTGRRPGRQGWLTPISADNPPPN